MADIFTKEKDVYAKYRRAVELAQQGLGYRRIAKEVGVSEGTVSGWLYYGKRPKSKFGNPHKLTEYEKGFLEALIDGEGFFLLIKGKRGVTALAGIGNTCLALLEKARSVIGGGRIGTDYKKRQQNSRTCYTLVLSSNILRWLLPQLKLVAKEEQRKVMIRALEVLEKRRGARARWHGSGTSKEIEKLVAKMRELNRRGRVG